MVTHSSTVRKIKYNLLVSNELDVFGIVRREIVECFRLTFFDSMNVFHCYVIRHANIWCVYRSEKYQITRQHYRILSK